MAKDTKKKSKLTPEEEQQAQAEAITDLSLEEEAQDAEVQSLAPEGPEGALQQPVDENGNPIEEDAIVDPDADGEVDQERLARDLEDTRIQAEGDFLEKQRVDTAVKEAVEDITVDIIGEKEVRKATEILKKYKAQKKNLEQRIIDNEQWWKLRHWDRMSNRTYHSNIKPTSAWLFNSIMNKLADYSDNSPEPNIRARMADDVLEAERIKNVLPMVLEANEYEKTYMETCLAKIKNGTSITGVFWNSVKDDIDIQPVDILSIYWQPGIKDIQASRNIFTVELVDNEVIEELYPDVEFKTGDNVTVAKYIYEDSIDTTGKSAVIDWYYRKDGKLHYCKYVNETVLIASENKPNKYPNGWYEDGKYPFVVDTLFKMEGSIAGFGYLDVCKSPQEYIDRLDQAILTNALMCSRPRFFKRNDSNVNVDEFLDWTTPLVTTNSNLGQDDLRQIEVNPLGSGVFNARDGKIQELKQTSGNSDMSTGVASSGVTAASAISQLIETGSKGSRHTIKGTYRAYREMIYLMIERMRQFYNEARYVRIIGDDGSEQFAIYDNSGLKEQTYEGLDGHEVHRLPMFDIEVSAQKSNPYSKMNQNELALQFYQYGFFNPQNADQTLSCLDMMDFDHKTDVVAKVRENQTMLQMIQQLQIEIQQIQEENQKLKVLCDLYIPGSNLTGAQNGEAQPQQAQGEEAPPEEEGEPPIPQKSQGQSQRKGSQAEQLQAKAANATTVM